MGWLGNFKVKMIIRINALRFNIIRETIENVDCSESTRHVRKSRSLNFLSWSHRQNWHLHRSVVYRSFPRRIG